MDADWNSWEEWEQFRKGMTCKAGAQSVSADDAEAFNGLLGKLHSRTPASVDSLPTLDIRGRSVPNMQYDRLRNLVDLAKSYYALPNILHVINQNYSE